MVLQNITVPNGTSTNSAGNSKDDSKSSNERKYVMMCKSMLDRELLPNDFDIWTIQEQCVWINKNIATIFPNVPKSLLDFIPASYYQDCNRSPTEIPEWLDIDKYRRGQKFVRENYVSLLFSKLLDITLLYSFSNIIQPIIISKRAYKPYLAFKRYTSTVQRFFNWYYGEPWIEGTLAYKDMQFTRRMHIMIQEKLDELDNEQFDNESKIAEPWCQYRELFLKDFAAACPSEKEGQRPYVLINKSPYRPKGMNHEDVAGTQCCLIGLLLLHPQNIGVHNATDDDIEAFCHMWRCYGYFLGIKDEYNFCRGSLEEIKQRARDFYQYWVLPNLKDSTPEWEHITRCIIEGINYILLNYMPYNVIILLAMDALNISMPHLYASMSWTEWISYKIWSLHLQLSLAVRAVPNDATFSRYLVKFCEAVMSYLTGGRLNIGLIQEQARKRLLRLLEKCDGPKAIIWDQSLAGPIGLVAKYNLLEEYGVVKMYPLYGGTLTIPPNITNVIFISRPQLELMDLIAENVHGEEGKRPRKEFHLFFVPRKSLLCQKKLQNRGVFGSFTLIEEFKCDLFPFDNDLLSMELSGSFKEFHLENDPTCLYQVAQAIQGLQKLYGKILKVTGRGPAASKVWELLERLNREEEDTKSLPVSSVAIEHLLLLDRSVDLLSPLVTQLTYEGLIDEIYGIKYNTVQLPARKFHDSDDSPTAMSLNEKEQIILNSGEELFAEIRDKNFNGVGPVLSKKAKVISSQFDERHGDKSVQEIKQFVARLPHMLATKQSLARHTTIAEMIKEVTDSSNFLESLQVEQELLNCIDTDKPNAYIEDMIAQQQPLLKVLRLLCIQSLTNSGLKSKLLDYYKREIIHTYGFQHLPTILNLEKAGLLKQQQSVRQYAVLRKALRLTVEDESEITPKDISYVHSIYAPLSVRLAEQLVQPNGWQGLNDVMGLLPGPTVSSVPYNVSSSARRNSITSEDSGSEPPKLILVFFIGGCTFAEISALRFLSQQEDLNVEFVVGTTRLINGNTFLTSLMEDLERT